MTQKVSKSAEAAHKAKQFIVEKSLKRMCSQLQMLDTMAKAIVVSKVRGSPVFAWLTGGFSDSRDRRCVHVFPRIWTDKPTVGDD